MSKYKYYFRKPKSEIVKDVFKILLISGMVCIAATSPYFGVNLIRGLKRLRIKKYKKEKIYDTFYNLKKQGYVRIEKRKGQIYISLTERGKKKAGWLQIDELKIERPQKWDKRWRVVIFDIVELKRIHREAFRGKLKELGFQPIQKSVWVYPFQCKDEIALLRHFFGLSHKDIRLITAEDIEKDKEFRELFKLN